MSGREHNDGKPDEVAVTEVSNEVLEELSSLFGNRTEPTGASGTDAQGATPPLGSTSVDGDATPVPVTGESADGPEVVEVVVIADEPGAPLDPLLDAMPRTDVTAGHDDIGTVVIVDDEMDRVVIVDDDRPDQGFEERLKRRARRERLRRVKWVKVTASLALIIVVCLALLASPLFAIRTVRFDGVVYTSDKSVEAARRALDGESFFTVDTASARETLLADPWVADVRVTTHFPGRALVEISERTPVVWYVGDDQKARVVDARGHVIAVLTGWPTKYLQVRGTGPSLKPGAIADDSYRAAAQLVIALPEELRPKVKFLEITGGGELSMTLTGGTLIRFGPPTGLQDKLVAVVVLLRRQNPSTLAVIDVSTGEPTVQTR